VAVTLNGVPSLAAHVDDDDAPVLEAHREAARRSLRPPRRGGTKTRTSPLVCGRPRQSRSPPPPPCKSSDRNEPSPHATDARNGSSGSIPTRYANPPRPMVLHLRSHAPTFHTDTLLSSDVVTAAPSLTQTLNTVLACALSGGPNLSTAIGALSKLASPTSSFDVQGPSKQIPAVARGDQVHGSRCGGPFFRFFIPGV
jgi:hypothetical protein